MKQNILYHYTNLEGFMGIMNYSRDKVGLWMSSSDYMNDKSERILSVQVLSNLVEHIEDTKDGELIFAPIFKQLAASESWKILRYFNQYVMPNEYQLILSLSKKRDYLPLWGRYADDGNGVAIGFDEKLLRKHLPAIGLNCNEAFYSNGLKISMDLAVKFIKPLIEKGRKEFFEQGIDPRNTANYILSGVCGFFKDENFSYEEEMRVSQIISKRNSEIKYRSSSKGIIPYKFLEIDKSIIKEIIAGPNDEPYLLRNSLIDFAFSSGLSGSTDMFKSSSIPFRK